MDNKSEQCPYQQLDFNPNSPARRCAICVNVARRALQQALHGSGIPNQRLQAKFEALGLVDMIDAEAASETLRRGKLPSLPTCEADCDERWNKIRCEAPGIAAHIIEEVRDKDAQNE